MANRAPAYGYILLLAGQFVKVRVAANLILFTIAFTTCAVVGLTR